MITRGMVAAASAIGAMAAIAISPMTARADDDGFIGKPRLRLAIDNCPVKATVTDDVIVTRFTEHYDRGVVLYVQGDFEGAISEFVAAHCLVAKASLLKDVAQAYERSVRYDLAIAYLQRFVIDTDDATERRNAAARLQVLSGLPSAIRIATEPPNAIVTVRDEHGVRASGIANTDDVMSVPAGSYVMTVEHPNYVPVEQPLTIGVGQPYSYSFRLDPRHGRLSIQTVPGDARILLDDRVVGLGAFEGLVDLGRHQIEVDHSGWVAKRATIEVTEQGAAEVSVVLERPPETARVLAVIGAAALGGYTGASISTLAVNTNSSTGGGIVAGLALGSIGGYLLIPGDIRQGTASFLLTTTAAGLWNGLELGAALSDNNRTISSIALGGAALGASGAIIALRQTDISAGQAALWNSGLVWGGISGGLFASIFGGSDRTTVAITAAGTNIGLVTGGLLARRYDVSRRRVIYIDLAGAAGFIAGLAVQNGAQSGGTSSSDKSRSHFTLAGAVIGLGVGTFLTRYFDAPRLRVQPTVTPSRDLAGGRTMIVGVSGSL
jgi:PEGA domain